MNKSLDQSKTDTGPIQGVKMPAAPELKATLTLPQTAFPMKANLPQNEPLRLARWASMGLYRRAAQGRPVAGLPTCFTTGLPTPTAPSIWVTP